MDETCAPRYRDKYESHGSSPHEKAVDYLTDQSQGPKRRMVDSGNRDLPEAPLQQLGEGTVFVRETQTLWPENNAQSSIVNGSAQSIIVAQSVMPPSFNSGRFEHRASNSHCP